ncbi:hypothetical protein CYMTET_30798, partial [Cymbomonas tetramitiformis]
MDSSAGWQKGTTLALPNFLTAHKPKDDTSVEELRVKTRSSTPSSLNKREKSSHIHNKQVVKESSLLKKDEPERAVKEEARASRSDEGPASSGNACFLELCAGSGGSRPASKELAEHCASRDKLSGSERRLAPHSILPGADLFARADRPLNQLLPPVRAPTSTKFMHPDETCSLFSKARHRLRTPVGSSQQ